MAVYTVNQIEKMLKKDGWKLVRKGKHFQYKHPIKKGTVSVPHHGGSQEVSGYLLGNIFKQAGWK